MQNILFSNLKFYTRLYLFAIDIESVETVQVDYKDLITLP